MAVGSPRWYSEKLLRAIKRSRFNRFGEAPCPIYVGQDVGRFLPTLRFFQRSLGKNVAKFAGYIQRMHASLGRSLSDSADDTQSGVPDCRDKLLPRFFLEARYLCIAGEPVPVQGCFE